MSGIRSYGWFGNKMLSLVVLISLHVCLFAQVDLPDKPDIIRVTVDHSDGGYLIQWEPSTDPDIASYRLYTRNNLVFEFVVAVPPDIFEYKYISSGIRNPAFAVTALDSSGNESLFEENVHRAVAAAVDFDPCTRANLISWEPYEGWDVDISAYEIFGREQGGVFESLGFVSPVTLAFTTEEVAVGSIYQYYISAVKIDGTISLSAIGSVSSLYPDPPDYITLDYVSVVNPSEVEIAFTADMTGEINDFRIMKRSNPGTPYVEVATVLDATEPTQLIIDEFPTSGNSYEYLVQSLYIPPSCSEPIILSESNPGTSILLEYEVVDQTISLSWTPYEAYAGGLAGYAIQRSSVNGEFFDVEMVGSGTETWQETIESVIDGYQTGELQYRVIARESLTGGGESYSNTVAVHVVTNLRVPNAFTPGSNDMNYEFKPLIDFAPRDYLMIVLDRGGRKLFETTDPGQGWDGRFQQGDFVAEGVYVYYIQYTDYTGLFKSFTGNVTVLYP